MWAMTMWLRVCVINLQSENYVMGASCYALPNIHGLHVSVSSSDKWKICGLRNILSLPLTQRTNWFALKANFLTEIKFPDDTRSLNTERFGLRRTSAVSLLIDLSSPSSLPPSLSFAFPLLLLSRRPWFLFSLLFPYRSIRRKCRIGFVATADARLSWAHNFV